MIIKIQTGTPTKVKNLVFNILDVFKLIGIPVDNTDRKLERMAKACLAVGKIKKDFSEACSFEDGFTRTRDIIAFENEYLGEDISSGSYDDIRRQDLKLLVEAGIIVNSSSTEEQATNNPSRGYGLSTSFANLLHSFGSSRWEILLNEFRKETKSLKEELERRRDLQKVPVTLPNGKTIVLSYGEHNNLQKAIIEVFLPLFGFGAEVLYVGDTKDKFLHLEKAELEKIKFFTLEHEELPDVVAYSREKNLLYLIEAYHSTGEWDEIRVRKVKRKLEESGCTANIIFFTAFENKNIFKQKAKDIAWETEVWIADSPEHLVHFNGYKFLELHK
ncbi:BsuBI/PstI family type II restriction endonuclease [Prevotella sp. CAG:592]|uniref:BsuBI/PstI family type II restriction endonuclease n=1 Tax=Prevotella sp. CAG:592 TaxID=1262931 RepID=UPI00033EB6F6|nr:BsuBI/PstI family type II restriction endonuclease [Prevotella sp. CAG:592]CDD06253.1 type II site-specific deoxyribonuclease [Prevotella sp. CAG:592]